MLHRTVSSIQVRKQISDRRISRLSLPLVIPYPHHTTSFPGPCHSRITLGPAFRVLEYYRARHGATLRRPPHSHPPSPLSYPSPLSPLVHLGLLLSPTSSLILGTNFRDPRIETSSKLHVRQAPPHSPSVRVFWFSVHSFSLSIFYVNLF